MGRKITAACWDRKTNKFFVFPNFEIQDISQKSETDEGASELKK